MGTQVVSPREQALEAALQAFVDASRLDLNSEERRRAIAACWPAARAALAMPAETEAADECAYCGCLVVGDAPVPATDDDAGWEDLKGDHARGCEWIATRAHRREAVSR